MTSCHWVARASFALILSLAAPATASAADRSSDGAVVVLASTATEYGIGSGTIVFRRGTTVQVLTADHVATHGALSLRFDDGAVVPARISSEFPSRDLAILEATVDWERAAALHVATLAAPRSNEPVYLWGSGFDGPAFEPAALASVGASMPDGPANGRFAFDCATCHRGDSGAGVFDLRGELVGVYLGYFNMAPGRNISVAQLPFAELPSSAQGAPDATAAAQVSR